MVVRKKAKNNIRQLEKKSNTQEVCQDSVKWHVPDCKNVSLWIKGITDEVYVYDGNNTLTITSSRNFLWIEVFFCMRRMFRRREGINLSSSTKELAAIIDGWMIERATGDMKTRKAVRPSKIVTEKQKKSCEIRHIPVTHRANYIKQSLPMSNDSIVNCYWSKRDALERSNYTETSNWWSGLRK